MRVLKISCISFWIVCAGVLFSNAQEMEDALERSLYNDYKNAEAAYKRVTWQYYDTKIKKIFSRGHKKKMWEGSLRIVEKDREVLREQYMRAKEAYCRYLSKYGEQGAWPSFKRWLRFGNCDISTTNKEE